MRLLKILLCALSVLAIHSTNAKSGYFIEEISVARNFEFYKILGGTYTKATIRRSDHLRASYFESKMWNVIDQEDIFLGYRQRDDNTVYMKINVDSLHLEMKNMSVGFAEAYTFYGRVAITDYRNNLLHTITISPDQFRFEDKVKVFDENFQHWIRPVTNEFPQHIADALVGKIIELIDELEVKESPDVPKLKLQSFGTANALQGPFDEEWNNNIIGIMRTGGDPIVSATLIDANGHFVCDYKMIHNIDELKAITLNGDTVNARLVSVNKSWDIALGVLEKPSSGRDFVYSEGKKIGQQVFVRGITGIEGVPVLCADGELVSKLKRQDKEVFITNAGFSGNFTGAPVFSETGELLGIAVVNGREGGEQTFACLPMAIITEVLNLETE